MNIDEDYRKSHLNKGVEYHDTFHSSKHPHRSMMWRIEKRILHEIVSAHFGLRKPSHLDFACGTGRVLSHLQPDVQSSTGVDVSHSMLSQAKANAPLSEIICSDITQSTALQGRQFDLITAFRFFPNAEDSLRMEAISTLCNYLKPGGLLVFNNHKNANSLTRTIVRLIRGQNEERTMDHKAVLALLKLSRLRIKSAHPLGVLPLTDRRPLRPVNLMHALESVVRKLPRADRIAQNIIYVAEK